MGRTINILSEILASKIAAGEVVQRPASVVKELLENSIDAKAQAITVIIKDVGKTLIQVIDDGTGMSREDAEVAFQRHATSKIAQFEDLENILTLGFRGEALGSIAAVAQVELRTRHAKSDIGTKVKIDGGNLIEVSEDSMAKGTSVLVKNLFYNTPARRKFLKSNTTEFKHIFDVIQRAAISHPEMTITFMSNNEKILDLKPSSCLERIKDVFGEKSSQTLFQFEDQTAFAKLSGFLGKPDFSRKSRIEQYLFLNNRYIINRSINHAVFQAYENLLEKGSFPFFILFLAIDPHRVDVNVHPSKMEVKFEDEQSMYRFIMSSIRKALSAHDLVPNIGTREVTGAHRHLGLSFQPGVSISGQRIANWEDLLRVDKSTGEISQFTETVRNQQPQSSVDQTTQQFIPGFDRSKGHFWQIHNKYIMVPIETGIMIIDQHAAHERVLYERAVIRFSQTHTDSQQLLFPHTIEMTSGDVTLVKQLQPLLEGLGFSLKIFGKSTVIVDGVPIDVKPGNESTILQDILDLFKEDEHNVKLEPREKLAKSFSCKAAVKAGDPLTESEMRSLLDQLFATEIPYVCPHGRPVLIKLSLSELDKRFGRTS